MSQPIRFKGLSVSPGRACGLLRIADVPTVEKATPDEVRCAFAAVAADRGALAERLRGVGRAAEADIIEVASLIAADPVLVDPAVAAVRSGTGAATAVLQAAAAQAAVLEALPVPELAQRAEDVRQVAKAVLDQLAAPIPVSTDPVSTDPVGRASAVPPGDFILVGQEVSPADLIELAEAGLVGAVSVTGGASSHAAIIARGLGVPMVTGVDQAVLAGPAGQPGLLDADAGELVVGASPAELRTGAVPARPVPAGPVMTADGQQVIVYCNVASAAETRRGLEGGAAGVGLLRTEIPFLGAHGWPSEAEHAARLAPILGLLSGRPATVRLLDFSGDKIPPFLTGQDGLAGLLSHPTALADQLTAVLEAAHRASLAILVPMVSSLDQVARVRAVLSQVAAAAGVPVPSLGIMVELAGTAAAAEVFAPEVDFFSIGTNDLTGQVLGLGRRDQAAGPALAAHPRVLALIARVTDAARRAGIPVSVCGDAAGDPLVLPLLVGLGVRSLSVPAAQVQAVRSTTADLDTRACVALAAKAMATATADEVWKLVAAL